MKKILVGMILVTMILLCCTSCVDERYDEGYDDGYYVGYDTGYSDGEYSGYENGSKEREDELAEEVGVAFWEMREEAREYGDGLHPEEALVVLEDYANGEATKEEYMSALDTISAYYWGTLECLEDTLDVDAY